MVIYDHDRNFYFRYYKGTNIVEILRDISLIIGIWVAIYGIDSWRREHIGKRKIELAEETLALFYEARDAISEIRNPWSWESETAEIKKKENESEDNYEARKMASIVAIRYEKHSELFNKIHSLRYRFMSQIGKNDDKPFKDLRKIVNEIFISVHLLVVLRHGICRDTNEQNEELIQKIEKHRSIIWENWEDNDPIKPRIENTIIEIENTCRKVIEAQGTLHGFSNLRRYKRNLKVFMKKYF